jgi:hypothetical protein
MEFIINQQARLVASQQKADERTAQLEGLVTRLAAVTAKGFEDTNSKINALIDAQMRTEEGLNKTAEAVRNLTAVVDRYFRERNGLNDSE